MFGDFPRPDDMSPVEINAKENYWIRARVAFVENSFSTIGDRLLPFIQDARLTYEYGDLLPVDYAEATNNCETVRIEDAAQTDSLGLLLYRPLPPEVPCLYLGFDQPFMGYPVNLYLDVEGQVGGRHEIEYQVWTGSSFEKLRTVDTTASMTGGGTVGLFMSDPAARGVFFGREGYWLRVLDVARPLHGKSRLPLPARHPSQRRAGGADPPGAPRRYSPRISMRRSGGSS